MKAIITILAVLVLGFLGWHFLSGKGADVPAETPPPPPPPPPGSDNLEEAIEEEGMMEEGVDGAMMEGTEHTFDVEGVDFAFDVTEIIVKKGDTVTINFTSTMGYHDWVVDEFEAATEQVTPDDGVTSVTFTADEAGTFEYYCSVGNHRAQGMVGNLVVEE